MLLALSLLFLLAGSASAHPLAPALLELREQRNGHVEVRWKTPNLGAPGSRLRPVLPSSCQTASPPRVESEDALGATQVSTIDCSGGLIGARLSVDGLAAANTQALLRVAFADGRVAQRVLTARDPAFTVPAQPQPWRVVADYAALGVEHIATGADHLLFVLGLVLLLPVRRALALAVTGFTLGHSLTLSLAVLGYASLPSRPVEVGIALSVLALAVELARTRPTARLRRFPWAVAAAFGLLHGLGFAGALREVGLPDGEVPLALLSFNGGIELGQLAFVAALLGAGVLIARLPLRLPPWAPHAPVYTMGTLAVFWTLQRAAALLP